MSQREPPIDLAQKQPSTSKHVPSKNVTAHLANERTFLAWVRTGLATITFGFVAQRFGLLLRQLGVKTKFHSSLHLSTIVGVALALFGVIIMVVALVSFLHNRRAIDKEEFYPGASFSIILTVLACLVGLLLAFYLAFNG